MEILRFGHLLLWAAAVLAGAVLVLCLLGLATRDRRFLLSARSGFYAIFVLLLGASITLVHGFLAGFYNNHYIYSYSERALITGFKLAGLWAGLDGSLVFWTLVQAGMAAAVALQYRWSARNASGRRMEPYVYLVLCTVLGFFIALAIQQDAFSEMGIEQRLVASERSRIPMDSSGNLLDGHGLNPQLVNCWFVLHPPCLYIGLVAFSVPFALALAALITGELGGYWLAVVRRWTMVAWIFLTSGIILGGLWAYRQLGWGGYWAWDPVENASFLPW
ncbi:MAG: cytochrome c biogenesis protein CcsA, partial [Planctomycetes bacterium]|nr:cytochrome c biogenesis protein CcsA [Planctomycetota bacterium]